MAGTGYVGKAGHLAVMAEFLLRGYSVAMPEVDVGDDIFVVHDRSGRLWRIQVKTAIGKQRAYGYSGQFAVALAQVEEVKEPDLYYVFALRRAAQWDFLVIPRQLLFEEYRDHGVGSVSGGNVILTLRFRGSEVLCSGRNFQQHRNNWSTWPLIARR
jgi:hypothetical protein